MLLCIPQVTQLVADADYLVMEPWSMPPTVDM